MQMLHDPGRARRLTFKINEGDSFAIKGTKNTESPLRNLMKKNW